MSSLNIKNFAQISKADVQFGDMTVFVGPQATGKSLILQLLKFGLDASVVAHRLKRDGVTWDSSRHGLLATFLGEGYEQAFSKKTEISFNGVSLLNDSRRSADRAPRVFFVPAQRVVTVANGWPRGFSDYPPGNPFVVKEFSQEVLSQFGRGLGGTTGALFPQEDRLKEAIRRSIEKSVFHGGSLFLKKDGVRKQLMLRYPSAISKRAKPVELPFLEWSAGQREFTPLLLGLYQLLPAGKIAKHAGYSWAVIEEPEMGLHPQAINSVMLLAFELLNRGYRVALSTHSPYALELLWALQTMKKSKGPLTKRIRGVLEALCLDGKMRAFARTLLTKKFNVYALSLDSKGYQCNDISSLDLDDSSQAAAGWGGVTSFSSVVSRAIAKAY